MQRASGYVAHVGLGYVLGLDLLKDLGIDAHLTVGTILIASGVNAEKAELAHGKTQAQGGKDGYGKHEHGTLEESGHTHHHGWPQGEAGRMHVRRYDIASGASRAGNAIYGHGILSSRFSNTQTRGASGTT